MTGIPRQAARTVVDVERVVLRDVPAGRERAAVAAFERALRDRGDGIPARSDPAGCAGESAARRIWERIEDPR